MTLTNLSVRTAGRPHAHRPGLIAAFEAAGDLLPPVRSMTEFVAMNPLGGLEHLPFDDAVARASDVFGAAGHLPEPRYRDLHDRGRIRTRHLRTALVEAIGDLQAPDVGGIAPLDVLVADLLASPVVPPTGRRLRTLAERHPRSDQAPASVDARTVRWCAAYLGGGASRWAGGTGGAELYPWWRSLATHDRSLPVGARRLLATIPVDPVEATAHLFDRCGIGPEDEAESVVAEVTARPGWAATLQAHDGAVRAAANLTALRSSLTIAQLGWPDAPLLAVRRAEPPRARAAASDPARRVAVLARLGLAADDEVGELVDRTLSLLHPRDRVAIWQRAHELTFRSRLVDDLRRPTTGRVDPPVVPDVQVVCCIDVRSEGLRRQLEGLGGYETFGFAGFFALPMRWRPATGGQAVASCPVPVTPGFDVVESPAGSPADRRSLAEGISGFAGASEGRRRAKSSPVAPYLYAEAAGWVTGPSAALRTLAPTSWSRLADRLRRRALRPRTTDIDLSAVPLDQQVAIAANALRTMGLTTFAPIVVLCGHTSETSANPYESGLRCGACGGHGGGPNARVLAHILNDPEVRAELAAAASITIPAGSLVLAAEHDTTTDEVTILDLDLVPPSHRERVGRIQVDLQLARLGLAHERCPQLPGARAGTPAQSVHEVERRAADWAEPCPEWGLAGNAAFIVGPRSTTRDVDLGRRVFLHSYDAELDPSGSALEVILTAPLVVAHGINAQYHFASTAPDVFGAGSKAVHNPVGTLGVLGGATGDLRLGLPLQSVAVGDELLHEPLRLLALVEAPLDRIEAILERHPKLRNLVTGGWLALIARESAADPWHERTPTGWTPLAPDAPQDGEP